MSYLSLSTWSLHRELGPLCWTTWNDAARRHEVRVERQPELLSLLELPATAATKGFQAVEVCHFHFPSTDEAYLRELRAAFSAAAVSFDTLLVDYGDLTTDDAHRLAADLELLRGWIDHAAMAGAKRVRIVAGEAPSHDARAIAASAAALSELAAYATLKGVGVVTENFKPLASTAASSLKLLEATEGRVGFITDFGNYSGDDKLQQIAATAPRSVSVHVKPHYDANGIPDKAGLEAMLDAAKQAGFSGAYVLIYDGPGSMWAGLERVKDITVRYL